ncbi:DNA-binding protein [Pseudonocardia sp. CNS-139]|nr:DNA-binding protein [Pseudonocardia sp. CNS-139]
MMEATGKKQADVAKILEVSGGKVSNLVKGSGAIAAGDLERLCNQLGYTDPGYQEALQDLRRHAHKRGSWSTGYKRAYSEDFRLLVDLERSATQLRVAEAEVVHGLLQCETYVRAQYAESPEMQGVSLEQRIAARLARQEILTRADLVMAQFVLSESCVRRVVGDGAVMQEQIDHLIELSQRPNVFLQVLPFDRPAPAYRPFALIRVPSPGVFGPLEALYVDIAGEVRYLDDKGPLAAHEALWARVTNNALRFDETRDFLRQVRKDFDT